MKSAAIGPIEARILTLRGQRVFPADFMFQLSAEEFRELRYQSGTSSHWGGRRHRPYAFTEQGVAMLSSALNSPRAVRVNIEIMRTLVRLRSSLAEHRQLTRRLDELEARYDGQFRIVFDAIRALVAPPGKPPKRIGFRVIREGD